MTNSYGYHFGFTESDYYKFYGESKDIQHALRDFCVLAQVLKTFLNANDINQFFEQRDCITWVLHGLSRTRRQFIMKFGIIFWYRWRWRNKRFFQSFNTTFTLIVFYIQVQIHNVSSYWEVIKFLTLCKNHLEENLVRWDRPPLGWTKINANVVMYKNFWNCKQVLFLLEMNLAREWMGSVTSTFGICYAFRANLRSLFLAFSHAWPLQVKHVIVELDNTTIVDTFRDKSKVDNYHANLLFKIQKLTHKL